MRSSVTLSGAFGARIDAVAALTAVIASPPDAKLPDLTPVAEALKARAEHFGEADAGTTYAGYADLVSICALLLRWRTSLLDAEMGAERHLRSARERYRIWLARYADCVDLKSLRDLEPLLQDSAPTNNVISFARSLVATPLPVGIFAKEARRTVHSAARVAAAATPLPLAVAFLEFYLDGKPVSDIQYLPPDVAHDLSIKVRVSRWPARAERLVLTPVTADSRSLYVLPTFAFSCPGGESPYILQKTGGAILKIPLSLGAHPLDIKYAAEFQPADVEQPVEVVGQRSLRLEGADWRKTPLTGYPGLDRRMVDIRQELRRMPGIPEEDLGHALTAIVALANLAGQAAQDARFDGVWKEERFQVALREHLRSMPSIGSQLQEHPRATGGITDFVFHNIPIELKAETDRTLMLADCQKFVGQTVSYAVGNGVRIGILCVLDTSPKSRPPFPAEDGIAVMAFVSPQHRVPVVAILIQGNIPRPNTHSK